MLPPPYFMVGMMFLQTLSIYTMCSAVCSSQTNLSLFHVSTIHLPVVLLSVTVVLANCRYGAMVCLESNGSLCGDLLWLPWLLNVLHMTDSWTEMLTCSNEWKSFAFIYLTDKYKLNIKRLWKLELDRIYWHYTPNDKMINQEYKSADWSIRKRSPTTNTATNNIHFCQSWLIKQWFNTQTGQVSMLLCIWTPADHGRHLSFPSWHMATRWC